MTKEAYYECDELLYDARMEELLQRSRQNRKLKKKAKYDDLDRLEKDGKKIVRAIEDLINEMEVEDFLMYGPRGTDPN